MCIYLLNWWEGEGGSMAEGWSTPFFIDTYHHFSLLSLRMELPDIKIYTLIYVMNMFASISCKLNISIVTIFC